MKQYTVIQKIRISKEMKYYLTVLHDIYKINSSEFIRQSIIEKLKRDMPEIRTQHKDNQKIKVPF